MKQLEPAFVIGAEERTRGGALSVEHLHRVSRTLLAGGFAVLPSDTAYSVAAIAVAGSTRTTINRLLRRGNLPVSLAFPSLPAARRWIMPNPVAESILRRYCPGPITVVCRGNPDQPASFFNEGIKAADLTIGVRIPDSVVERDVAAATGYPVTTIAVRDLGTGAALTSFETTLEVVESGVEIIGGARWCAVEGAGFYEAHSTVVQVYEDGRVTQNRAGDIAFEQILAVVGHGAAVGPDSAGTG